MSSQEALKTEATKLNASLNGNPAWLHGASLGDINSLAPFVQLLHDTAYSQVSPHPILSAVTRSGLGQISRIFPTLKHYWAPILPAPYPWYIYLQNRPSLLLLERLELWPHWLSSWSRQGVRCCVINGLISPRTLRARAFLRSSFQRLDLFLAQREIDAERAVYMGTPSARVFLCGSSKYDAILARKLPNATPLHLQLGRYDLVIGCLASDEEDFALTALSQTSLRALIAPRHLSRVPSIIRKARSLGVTTTLRSSIGHRHQSTAHSAQWVILDTYGELSSAYQLAPFAIIGGTFGRRGGQNMIEAAMSGARVNIGPNIGAASLEKDHLLHDGVVQHPTYDSAVQAINRWMKQSSSDWPPKIDLKRLNALRGSTLRQLKILNQH